VDLAQQDQLQRRADARYAAQQLVRHRVVDLGVPRQVQLQGADPFVVGARQPQVGADALLRAGVGEVACQFVLVAVAGGRRRLQGQHGTHPREEVGARGKRTTRRVPLTPLLKKVLKDWLGEPPAGPYLFCHGDVVSRSKPVEGQSLPALLNWVSKASAFAASWSAAGQFFLGWVLFSLWASLL
jgi:hypothetical protein